MADPLSISASIAALLQLTGSVVSYLNGVKSAPDEIKRLNLELCTMRGLLSMLQDDLSGLDSSSLDLLEGVDGVFPQFESLLERMMRKSEKDSIKRVGRLLWPLQKEDVKDLLSSLERLKSSLSIVLQNNQRVLSLQFSNGITQLEQNVGVFKSALQDAKRSRALRWLSAPDPSSNHNAACAARSPTTGDWFLRSAAFNSWLSGCDQCLWVHGFPGCGKSVLASTIIEHVSTLCEAGSNLRLLYFYFDFRSETKQNLDGFLRSMLVQLCCGATTSPEELQKLYDQSEGKKQQPTIPSLADAFVSILRNCQKNYIIVDALDECSSKYSPAREGMLSLIKRLTDDSSISINTLILSRREQDIEKELRPIITGQVCIQNKTVDADIRVHVRRLLVEDPRLKNRSPSVKEEIESSIVNGARGMFRWAVCQIEVLRECRRITILRDALNRLPEDLDETYNRILSSISRQDRNDAITALKVLAVSPCALSVADVAEAVVIDSASCYFEVEDRLPDPFDIVDVLSSLVSCSSRQIPMRASDPVSGRYVGAELATEIRLAHYSVKEYLVSDRIQRGSSSGFHIAPYEAHKTVAKMCLTYLLQFDQFQFNSRKIILQYPFCPYAAEYWYHHARAAYEYSVSGDATSDNQDLTDLIVRLLDDRRPSFINWLRLCDPCDPRSGVDNARDPECMPSPMFYACLIGLLDVARVLRDQGADINACNLHKNLGYRRPLSGAIVGKHPHMVKFLVGSGVNVNAVNDWGMTALHRAVQYGDELIAELLLQSGAALEAKTGPVVPYRPVQTPPEDLLQVIANGSSTGHTSRLEISTALTLQLLRKQMCLESNRFMINPIGKWPTPDHYTVLKTLMYGGDRHEELSATGWTPLHEASWAGHIAVVKLLLQKGADYECKTRYGWTPLLCAVWQGHAAVVGELIERGANINVRSAYGWTPLHAARREPIVRLLLDNKADVNAKTSYGWTPLFSALSHGDDTILALLIERGADVDAYNVYGGTALHKAARAGDEVSVERLLRCGANRFIKSAYGTIAVEEAARLGHEQTVQLLRSIPDRTLEPTDENRLNSGNLPISRALPLLEALPSVRFSGNSTDALLLVLRFCLDNRNHFQ